MFYSVLHHPDEILVSILQYHLNSHHYTFILNIYINTIVPLPLSTIIIIMLKQIIGIFGDVIFIPF